jgi:transposase
MITDGLWAAMEPLVNRARRHKGGRPPVLPDRMSFEATLDLARTGIPLRDLPGSSAPGTPSTTGSAGWSPPALWPGCSS